MSASARFLAVLFSGVIIVSGCTSSNEFGIQGTTSQEVSFSGSVHGGQQPVAGATIQLYSVGTTADGATSTPLLTSTVTSAGDGTFNITGLYSCTNATLVYITASGGNPGLGASNPNLALMTALGPCSALSPSTFIQINELTTIAAVNSLAPYMSSQSAIGSAPSDQTALATAFSVANELVSSATGTSPGVGVPPGASIPINLIDTLGNILASCVNSTGGTAGDASLCGQFFAEATPGNAAAPNNTIAALLDLANNPSLNTSLLYGLVSASSPFLPTLAAAPADFRILPLSSGTAALQFTPAILNFTNTIAGTTSASLPVSIQNTGSLPVALTTLVLVGADASDFAFASNCPATLSPSASCTAMVNVTPSVVGARIAYLSVSSNSAASPQFVALNVPPATPVISQVSPSPFYINTGATVMYTFGSNMSATSVILWNGSPLTTRFVGGNSYYGNYLYATVPASLLTTVGTSTVTVSTPGAPSISNAITVNLSNPPVPTLTSISPAGVPLNTATQITVNGAGFDGQSTVQLDGTPLVSAFLSSGSLTALVPASMVALPGNHSVTVVTPAPGGGTSTPGALTAYVGIQTNAMALNPANGLLYVSVPGAAGAPYGNSVVSVDPATGALGVPIYVGSEPDKLAISSDGTTMWVGLDGASAVREVNLTTSTAGMQFPLADNSGVYDYPPVVHALAILPGFSNSIVASVATNNGLYEDSLVIYDSGVPRASQIALSTIGTAPAIFINPTKAEVYATSYESGYQVLSYDAAGLHNLAGNSGSYNYNAPYGTAVQIDNGVAYLDTGMALGAETGTVLGTFYRTGTTVASGPMVSDSSLGTNFILETGSSTTPSPVIQAFNETTFAPIPSATIPVGGALSGSKYGAGNSTETTIDGYNNIDTLVRWGANGLAFRAANGIFSFRSNIVKDLSSTNADLSVALSTPASAATGTTITATATVTNQGPNSATDTIFTQTIPSSAVLVSVGSTQGTCAASSPVTCNLGTLSSGASASVTLTFQVLSSGTAATTVNAVADQNDPSPGNNSASASTMVSGTSIAPIPGITSISPSVALAGSQATTITIVGTGFVNSSLAYIGSTPLNTAYVNSTQLQAVIPSAQLATLGWLPISVVTQQPGGGTSNPQPFSVYSVVSLTANHMIFDPYSRLLYASVNSAATQVAGNTLVSIDPATGNLGTPIPAGNQPSSLALTDDGQYLYVNQTGSSSVGRFKMSTQSFDFSFPITPGSLYSYVTPSLRDIATMPGTDNTVAVDTGLSAGFGLWDVDPVLDTATARGTTSGTYTGSSLQFLSASTIFSFDIDTSGNTFNAYTAGTSGLLTQSKNSYTLNSFSAFKIRNGIAYANFGGVANPALAPVQQLGVFLQPTSNTGNTNYYGTYGQLTEPDPSLGLSFFANLASSTSNSQYAVGVQSFQQATYAFAGSLTMPFGSSAGSQAYPSLLNISRWGPDGIAVLASTGQIVLFRGAFVVPQLLNQNTPAVLTASSVTSLSQGSGNVLLTLTGSNFIPGVAVQWNGSYRTTTIVDSTHITVAIPASDLATIGNATLTATNPGASSSGVLVIAIN